MKAFISFFLAIATLMLMGAFATGCNGPSNGPNFTYGLTVEGNATGDVTVDFPNGVFQLSGSADLLFNYSNILSPPVGFENTKNIKNSEHAVDLVTLASSTDSKSVKLASDVYTDIYNKIGVSSTSGSYRIRVYGVVHDETTGLDIKIDKEFTNNDPYIPN